MKPQTVTEAIAAAATSRIFERLKIETGFTPPDAKAISRLNKKMTTMKHIPRYDEDGTGIYRDCPICQGYGFHPGPPRKKACPGCKQAAANAFAAFAAGNPPVSIPTGVDDAAGAEIIGSLFTAEATGDSKIIEGARRAAEDLKIRQHGGIRITCRNCDRHRDFPVDPGYARFFGTRNLDTEQTLCCGERMILTLRIPPQ